MTIEYSSTRGEIFRWYLKTWRASRATQLKHALLFCIIFVVTLLSKVRAQADGTVYGVGPIDVVMSVILGLVSVAFFWLYPQIAFKPQRRMLSISPSGITTTIGAKSGTIAWAQVASIRNDGEAVVITGKNRNAFVVPRRAFETAEHRQQFLDTARNWMAESRAAIHGAA